MSSRYRATIAISNFDALANSCPSARINFDSMIDPLPRFSCVFSSLPRFHIFLTNPFVSDEIGASNLDHIKIYSTIG